MAKVVAICGGATLRTAQRRLRPRVYSMYFCRIGLSVLLALGCEQGEDHGTLVDAVSTQDGGSEDRFVPGFFFLLPVGAASLSPEGLWGPDIAYVDVKIVWSKFPHEELASWRVQGDFLGDCFAGEHWRSEEAPKDLVHQWWPFTYVDRNKAYLPFSCCDFGEIDAVGLGYSPVNGPYTLRPRAFLALPDFEIPDPARFEIHTSQDVFLKPVDALVQAYDCSGAPFRPRRFCGNTHGAGWPPPHFQFDTMGQDNQVFPPYSAILSHSIALPMRHAVLGTFPACPADVTATCGDNACDWPEDEVNCFRDCHWVSWPPP